MIEIYKKFSDEREPSFPTRDRDAAIYRLCGIKHLAHEYIGYLVASDCLCCPAFGGEFREDGNVLDFIEAAVREKIAREQRTEAR